MSLTISGTRVRRLWPLWLLAVTLAGTAFALWLHWTQILLQSVIWQKELHQQMTQLLQQVKAEPDSAGGMLVLLAWLMAYCMRWGRVTAKLSSLPFWLPIRHA